MNSSNVFFRRCSRWFGGVEGPSVCTIIFAKFALPAYFEIGTTAICGILKTDIKLRAGMDPGYVPLGR